MVFRERHMWVAIIE
uniref:Uncharacterized protein n=1 Tax=Anguilla anguilla TaxID=7936 RepID=A0A0E9UK70_ANGAN